MPAALKYDLVAIDLDGTLLDRRDRIPERNRAALHRAHDAGLKVVLCTGRAYTETRPVLDALGLDLDAAISVFGALITDVRNGTSLEVTPMDEATGRAVTQLFLEHGYPPVWLCDASQTGHDGFEFAAPRRHAGYEIWRKWTTCVIQERAGLPAERLPPALRVSIIGEEQSVEVVATDLRERLGSRIAFNSLRIPSAGVTVIETFAAGVSKWSGIEKLCRRWGIDPRRTVAVGDEVNDIEMVRSAGLGVAMGNAHPRLREVARHVTCTNEDCGVATLIDAILDNRL